MRSLTGRANGQDGVPDDVREGGLGAPRHGSRGAVAAQDDSTTANPPNPTKAASQRISGPSTTDCGMLAPTIQSVSRVRVPA